MRMTGVHDGSHRPDAKSQVSVVYRDGRPVAISNVVISTQHSADVEHREIEKFCIENIVQRFYNSGHWQPTQYSISAIFMVL